MRVEIISGSPRQGSQTKRVALHLFNELKTYPEVRVGLIDLSAHNLPPVQNVFGNANEAPFEFKETAASVFKANAFILVTPEYNGSYSPAMKNLLDHFPKQRKKTFGIVAASPGAFGGIRAAMQLQNLTYGLMGIGSPEMLIVPELNKKFRPDGTLIDLHFKASVASFIEQFLWLSHAVLVASTEVVQQECA
jgi:NAD(P)H-dependent FMN reductase